MIKLGRTAPKKKGAKAVKPGVYDSVVLSVKSPDGFADGNAIDIEYDLVDAASGVHFPYQERFHIAEPISPRTFNFEQYLLNNGLKAYEEFVGCSEELTLLKEVRNGRTYTNIVERSFISKPLAQTGGGQAVKSNAASC